jgi:hypothetical protein
MVSAVTFTQHALDRIAERLLITPSELADIALSAIEEKRAMRSAPAWRTPRRSRRHTSDEDYRWIRFSDEDGKQCAAVMSCDLARIITVYKRTNDMARTGSKGDRRTKYKPRGRRA